MVLLSSVVDLAIESLTIGMGPVVSVEDIVLKMVKFSLITTSTGTSLVLCT